MEQDTPRVRRPGAGRPLGSRDSNARVRPKLSDADAERRRQKMKSAGRPKGARDKYQRVRARTNPPSPEYVEKLRGMVRDAELSEYFFTNDAKVFNGSSLEFLQAVVRAEQLPVKTRLYAANKAVEFERHLLFDMKFDAILANDELMAEFEERCAEHTRERDAKLALWVESGKMTADAALLARSLYSLPEDPLWQPPKRR